MRDRVNIHDSLTQSNPGLRTPEKIGVYECVYEYDPFTHLLLHILVHPNLLHQP
jgi:hypothetical protein